MKKVAVFIDGGHLRACAKQAKQAFTADFIVDLPNRRIIPESKPHLDYFRQLATWP